MFQFLPLYLSCKALNVQNVPHPIEAVLMLAGTTAADADVTFKI